jgi:hypothetical protein
MEYEWKTARDLSEIGSIEMMTVQEIDLIHIQRIDWMAGVGDVAHGGPGVKKRRYRKQEEQSAITVESFQPPSTVSIENIQGRNTHRSKRSALQRHCDFWDADHDGLIYPWDIFVGFRKLGFNVALSIWAAITMALCSSYSTQTSWCPHPLFAINLDNIHRSRHGSTTTTYDMDAELDLRRFDAIFTKYAQGKAYLTWRTMYDVWAGQCCANDFFGWFAGGLECKGLPIIYGR